MENNKNNDRNEVVSLCMFTPRLRKAQQAGEKNRRCLQRKYISQIEEEIKDCQRCAKMGYGAGSRVAAAYRAGSQVFLLISTGIVKRKIRFLEIGRGDTDGSPPQLSQGRKPTGEAFLLCRQRGAGMTCLPG